jgi:hypothetical protein
VEAVRGLDPPGRFLEKDPNTGLWSDIGHKKAVEKTSQALRDGAANLRQQLSADLGDPDFLNEVFGDNEHGQASKSDPAKKAIVAEKYGSVETTEVLSNDHMDTDIVFSGKQIVDKVKVAKKVRGLLYAMNHACVKKSLISSSVLFAGQACSCEEGP